MHHRPVRVINGLLLGGVAALLSLLLAATPALGANRQAQEKAARKACLSGDYAKGVSILADLFVNSRDPIYLFNQGRCFEQNIQYREAIGRFEEYLRMGETATLDPSDRAAAEKHIADCKARVLEDFDKAKGPAPAPESVVQPSPPVLTALPAPASVPKPEPTVQTVTPTEAPKNRSGLVAAGIVVGIVGVAAGGAGLAFNFKVNSMVNDMETKPDGYTTSKDSSRKAYETSMWVGYGVGAACIATGAILVTVGLGSRHGSSPDVALLPALGPDRAGVLLSGGF
jgi:hypothetical protein